jgi:hypothetical protein
MIILHMFKGIYVQEVPYLRIARACVEYEK